MRSTIVGLLLVGAWVSLWAVPAAQAQPLGTLRWQLQPYCNVVTVNVTGVAGVYTLEGFDDQCGAPNRAPLTGVATPNPDGTIGFGLHVVTAPGGRGLQIDARITMAALTGPWTDSEGHTGTFAFDKSTGGSPRPLPATAPLIPATINMSSDGGIVAGGVSGTGTIPASGPGTRMMWHPAKAAFRAGKVTATMWDDATVGESSTAFGLDTVASGAGAFAAGRGSRALAGSATAFGTSTVASGGNSTALGAASTAAGYASFAAGLNSVSSGSQSVAMGSGVIASGNFSVALGLDSKAIGIGSVAAGVNAIASGLSSVALGGGSNGNGALASGHFSVAIGQTLDAAGAGSMVFGSNAVTTQAAYASFVYGDASSTQVVQSFFPNEFKVRAAGGTYFFSNGAMSTGVKLAPNASAWSTLSDANSKENFRDLAGDDVLAKIARMPVREWNYKAQDAAIRHVGPTAQDFHAAFGLGEDPLRISTIDADGIALAAAKALILENQTLKTALEALQARVDRLEAQR